MALHFDTVWPPASECTFFKYPSSWPERIKRFKMAAIIQFDLDVPKKTVQGGCCTTVVVYKSINKNGERSTFICNNFHAERAQSVPVPSCSSWEQKLCNMFSFTIVLLSV